MHELSATSFCKEELLNNALNYANVHVPVIRDDVYIVADVSVRLSSNKCYAALNDGVKKRF